MKSAYYRLTKLTADLTDDDFCLGDLWYLLDTDAERAEIVNGDDHCWIDLETFKNNFEYAPDGFMERQRDLIQATSGLHEISESQQQLRLESSETPHLEETTDLRLNGRDPIRMKDQVKKAKTLAAKARNDIAKQQRAMERFIKEQEIILRERAEALTKTIKIAEEAIYVLNAYLGKDEEIVQIHKGANAPADMKITMRQLVLYMDEETGAHGAYAADGGVDFEKISWFDKWVKEPKNLNQVLPEEKGVVAIKPRRNDKFYCDNPFVNAELNRKNRCLYVLIRNGENVYRIYTSLWLQDVFFPKKDQFEKFFYDKWTQKPLKPGSKAYMEAMEDSQAEQRRYYTVLILLQGLLDRTKVFEIPEEIGRINLSDFNESVKYVRFLYDAEMMLGDGRVGFNEWRDEINSKLDVGHRVILRDRQYKYEYPRVRPKTASGPPLDQVHTIEAKEGKAFIIRYSREGDVIYTRGWRGWDSHEAKNRASYRIETYDEGFINFDLAKVEDLEYYVNSRLHRHHYENMIPLLKWAIKLKKEEEKDEAPFRKLLVGEIMKNGGQRETAEAKIKELVEWWKLKNRTHRALTSDDAKAIRMITKEFERRITLEASESTQKSQYDEVIENLRSDDTLSIWHKKDNEYVVLSFQNAQNVFVTETTYRNLTKISSKADKTVDKRHQSWKLLWEHERWADWLLNPNPNDYLTQTEQKEAIEFGLKEIKKEKKGNWGLPLAGYMTKYNHLQIYVLQSHAVIPETILTGEAANPHVKMFEVTWTKTRSETKFCSQSAGYIVEIGKLPWLPGFKDQYRRHEPLVVHFIKEENVALGLAEKDQVDTFHKRQEAFARTIPKFSKQIDAALDEAFYAEEKIKFDDQYHDENNELWEDHKKELKRSDYHDYTGFHVDQAAEYLYERDIDVHGMTVAQVLKEAKKYGCRLKIDDDIKSIKDLVLDRNLAEMPEYELIEDNDDV